MANKTKPTNADVYNHNDIIIGHIREQTDGTWYAATLTGTWATFATQQAGIDWLNGN